ncbi:hypothetical protein H0H92_001472 [Tricholoma furcatifolium]|nr:hypothetical protein H0H92_001472 [Tricholoma furcatifolium]
MSTSLTMMQKLPCLSLSCHPTLWINFFSLDTALAGLGSFIIVYLVVKARAIGDTIGGRNTAKWPFPSPWTFFSQRYALLNKYLAAAGDSLCTLRLLHYRVTVVTGEEGKRAFFENKSMDFVEGYKRLRFGGPRFGDLNVRLTHRTLRQTVPMVLSSKRLFEVLPPVLEMIQAQMEAWGPEGLVNHFDIIPDLIFHMAVGFAGCRQLANDEDAIQRMKADYNILETSSTPMFLLLPWLRSKRKTELISATRRLYDTVLQCVNARREANTKSLDTIDFLLNEEWRTEDIVA